MTCALDLRVVRFQMGALEYSDRDHHEFEIQVLIAYKLY